MGTREVVGRFYQGLARNDGSWQQDLADDVSFADASGRLKAEGREAFVESFSGFLPGVVKVELRQLIVDGEDAAAVVDYQYRNSKGEHLRQNDAEIWKVEANRIRSLTIHFDITEFRAFMAR